MTVFNTGKPIPEEDVPRIWDKFFKVDKAHTREYGGNGIGLSIVKAIMESMHQQYGVKITIMVLNSGSHLMYDRRNHNKRERCALTGIKE